MRRTIFTLGCLLVPIVAGGCQNESEIVVVGVVDTEIPEQYTDAGVTWQAAAVTAADNERLAKFFQNRPDLAGSPDLQGQPVLFRAGERDLRFFWLSAAVDTTKWSCVAFESGRFSTSDGEGSPFGDSSSSLLQTN